MGLIAETLVADDVRLLGVSMPKPFTKKEIQAYFEDANQCPRCGGSISETSQYTPDSNNVWRYFACENEKCLIEYTEEYKLVDIFINEDAETP